MTIVGPDCSRSRRAAPRTMAPGTPATFTLDVHNAGTGSGLEPHDPRSAAERRHGRHLRRRAHRDHRARVPGRRHDAGLGRARAGHRLHGAVRGRPDLRAHADDALGGRGRGPRPAADRHLSDPARRGQPERRRAHERRRRDAVVQRGAPRRRAAAPSRARSPTARSARSTTRTRTRSRSVCPRICSRRRSST